MVLGFSLSLTFRMQPQHPDFQKLQAELKNLLIKGIFRFDEKIKRYFFIFNIKEACLLQNSDLRRERI